jgi:hypothetical protein
MTNIYIGGRTVFETYSDITNLTVWGNAVVTISGTASIDNLIASGAAVIRHNSSGSISGAIWKDAKLTLLRNVNPTTAFPDLTLYGGTADFRSGINAASH